MNDAPGSFDEAKALERLEHLHGQILRAQAERRRVEAEFDAFVMGFKREQPTADAPAGEPERQAVRVPDPAPVPVAQEPTTPVIAHEETVVPEPPARPRGTSRAAPAIVVAAVLLGGIAFALRSRDRAPAEEGLAQAPRAPESAASARPQAAPAVPPAPAQTGVNVELITRRTVWVRVTIDGRRAFERELPPNQRIPLHAEKTILIRAGDAGAVSLMRDGRDAGPLGRDGMIATREITAAPGR